MKARVKEIIKGKSKLDIIKDKVAEFFQDENFLEYFKSFKLIEKELVSFRGRDLKDFDSKKMEEIRDRIEDLDKQYSSNANVVELKRFYKEEENHWSNILGNKLNDKYSNMANGSDSNAGSSQSNTKEINTRKDSSVPQYLRLIRELGKDTDFKEYINTHNREEIELKYPKSFVNFADLYQFRKASNVKVQRVIDKQIASQLVNINKLVVIFESEAYRIEKDGEYSDQDISIIGQKLIYGQGFNQDNSVYLDKVRLSTINKDFIEKLLEDINIGKTIFIAFNQAGTHWVSLCITAIDGRLKVVHKDAAGSWGDALKIKFKEHVEQIREAGLEFSKEDFIVEAARQQGQKYDSGVMCLRNLEIMASIIAENGVFELIGAVTNSNIQFCKESEVIGVREQHNALINEFITESGIKSDELLEESIAYFNEINSNENVDESLITVEKELLAKIDAAIKINPNNLAAHSFKADLLFKIALLYEEQENYQQAFNYVDKSIITSSSNSTSLISSVNVSSDNDQRFSKKSELELKLEEFAVQQPSTGIRDQEEILNLIAQNNNTYKLKSQMQRVKNLIPEYTNWNKKQIRLWSDEVKANPSAYEDIAEYIAVIDRANYIDTLEKYGNNGHNLRDTQIASILSFFDATGNGRLAQIKTGEGKSTIVSVLAIIKALRGKHVDILTSSAVLAERDAEEKEGLYKIFGLTVSDNSIDKDYQNGPKECYQSDIVYGSISNFQFDLLRHEHQGLETRGKEDNQRRFDTVIVDEVDSMLIDNGGHLAKLSGPLPGMEYLQPLLIFIWGEVSKLAPLLKILTNFTGKSLHDIEKFEELKQDIKIKIKEQIIDSFIPKHLTEYASDSQIDKWIGHAFSAAVLYNSNREYTIKEKDGEEVISPVDYRNTGSIQTGTIWSDGLHQFLQIKHGLRITSESCNTSYISNVGYIRKYMKKSEASIYGLTGTLGDKKEQNLLSESYDGLDFISIPTFKEKLFEEISGRLHRTEESWLFDISKDVLLIAETRSVLIICETILEATLIKTSLETSSKGNIRIQTYLEETHSSVTEDKVNIGDIIIATNLAGRGTDIKTASAVEINGGLHVCVTFMPCNQRVEDQAFGRTARQGNKGTAQLIIKESGFVKSLTQMVDQALSHDEDLKASVLNNSSVYFTMLKKARDLFEEGRLDNITENRLQVINLGDELFNEFSSLSKELKDNDDNPYWFGYTLKAIEERWGFWLKRLDLNSIEDLDPDRIELIREEFNDFKSEIKAFFDHSDSLDQNTAEEARKNASLKVISNPYYLITIGNLCNKFRDFSNAKKALELAISLDSESEITATAHYLLAFVEIELARGTENVIVNAVSALVPFLNLTGSGREEAIDKALHNLAKASEGVGKIKSFYESMFESYKNLARSPDSKRKLLEHLQSKVALISLYGAYIEANKKSIDSLRQDGNGFLSVKKITEFTLEAIDFGNEKENKNQAERLKEKIKVEEIKELSSAGLRNIYQVSKIYDIPSEISKTANIEILTAISLYTTCLLFPPSAVALVPIASISLSEGISDIMSGLVDYTFKDTERPFDGEAFAKKKAISLGVSLGTLGLGALMKVSGLLKKAIDVCQNIADSLKGGGGIFGKIGEFIAKGFDQIAEKLTKILNSCTANIDVLSSLQEVGRESLELALDEVKAKFLDQLKLGDISKLIDVAINCRELSSQNMLEIIEAVPATNVQWLDRVKNFAIYSTKLEGYIKDGNFQQMLQKFPDTGVAELDNIKNTVQQIGNALVNIQQNLKHGDITSLDVIEVLNNFPPTGITEIDNIKAAIGQVNTIGARLQQNIKSGDIIKTLHDFPDTGVAELDNIKNTVQQIGNALVNIQQNLDSGDVFAKLKKLALTGVTEIDSIKDTLQQTSVIYGKIQSGCSSIQFTQMIDNMVMTGITGMDEMLYGQIKDYWEEHGGNIGDII